jgi:hypothetical protein
MVSLEFSCVGDISADTRLQHLDTHHYMLARPLREVLPRMP